MRHGKGLVEAYFTSAEQEGLSGLCRPVDGEPRVLVEVVFPGRDLGQAGIQGNVRGQWRSWEFART